MEELDRFLRSVPPVPVEVVVRVVDADSK
jgi:hypothetical protein